MVLHPPGCGRVGHRRTYFREGGDPKGSPPFLLSPGFGSHGVGRAGGPRVDLVDLVAHCVVPSGPWRAVLFDPELLDKIITETVARNAVEVDRTGAFPRENIDALAEAGFLGVT